MSLEYVPGKQYCIKDGFSERWICDGRLHREDDQPAFITSTMSSWYQGGLLHRENDQPAVVYSDGTREWYFQGQLHRENDRPAVVYSDGTREWYFRGQLHRENDRPAAINADGTKEWYFQGKLHRENNQPAVIRPEIRCVEGVSASQPAAVTLEYWVNGEKIREEKDWDLGLTKAAK